VPVMHPVHAPHWCYPEGGDDNNNNVLGATAHRPPPPRSERCGCGVTKYAAIIAIAIPQKNPGSGEINTEERSSRKSPHDTLTYAQNPLRKSSKINGPISRAPGGRRSIAATAWPEKLAGTSKKAAGDLGARTRMTKTTIDSLVIR
jgi:hypothetical protein